LFFGFRDDFGNEVFFFVEIAVDFGADGAALPCTALSFLGDLFLRLNFMDFVVVFCVVLIKLI
jgi:hypothetical protein